MPPSLSKLKLDFYIYEQAMATRYLHLSRVFLSSFFWHASIKHDYEIADILAVWHLARKGVRVFRAPLAIVSILALLMAAKPALVRYSCSREVASL